MQVIALSIEAAAADAFGLVVWTDGVGLWWVDPKTRARGLHSVNGRRAGLLAIHRANLRRKVRGSRLRARWLAHVRARRRPGSW